MANCLKSFMDRSERKQLNRGREGQDEGGRLADGVKKKVEVGQQNGKEVSQFITSVSVPV